MSRVLPLYAAMLLAGCNQDMARQPRYDPYEAAGLFDGGAVFRDPPEGTVERDAGTLAQAAERPEMTLALIERGRERYGIYCIVCHGEAGEGDGPVVERGFPHPPSFQEARLRAAPASHIYDVITHGYGVMYSYAARVPPADRWAIAAYVRALQAAKAGAPSDAGDADAGGSDAR